MDPDIRRLRTFATVRKSGEPNLGEFLLEPGMDGAPARAGPVRDVRRDFALARKVRGSARSV
jgi:hypothetical protein